MSAAHGDTRFGVVDIGSNTVKMSVYACERGSGPVSLADDADTVRIGYRVGETGVIASERLERLLACLRSYERLAVEHGATEFLAVATQAFRIASNTDEVVRRIERETAWRVRVIDEQEETRLTIEGARPWLFAEATNAVADIGGASTEIIAVSEDQEIIAAGSLPIGSGLLFDRHVATSPPPVGSLERVRDEALATLDMSGLVAGRTDHLLLAGGTGFYLNLLLESLEPSAAFVPASLPALHDWLATRHAIETMERIPVQLDRAQVLPASLAVVEALVLRFAPSDIRAVPSGIRDGIARIHCSRH